MTRSSNCRKGDEPCDLVFGSSDFIGYDDDDNNDNDQQSIKETGQFISCRPLVHACLFAFLAKYK